MICALQMREHNILYGGLILQFTPHQARQYATSSTFFDVFQRYSELGLKLLTVEFRAFNFYALCTLRLCATVH
jgi:hypothetical protein